ncbi:MAG: KEOPS complex subunit Cgi121 [Halobacteriaceae archaeon]
MRLVEGVASVADTDAFVAALQAVGDDHGCAVQALDARLVAGRDHLEAAVEHARRSFVRGENVARDPAVEVLLYAAGRRQITRALELGVSEGETPAVVVVDALRHYGDAAGDGGDEDAAAQAVRDLGALTPASALDRTDEAAVRAVFDVSERERAATAASLSALVCERVALLDVEK